MKVLRVFCASLVVLLFLIGALAALLPTAHEDSMLGVRRGVSFSGLSSPHSFTLIMQSFNRTDLLLKMLNHYQAMPHLHRIIVVWNNVGQDPPQELWESLGPHPVSVYFKKQSVNLMRNRLQNFPEIQTKAVLMMMMMTHSLVHMTSPLLLPYGSYFPVKLLALCLGSMLHRLLEYIAMAALNYRRTQGLVTCTPSYLLGLRFFTKIT
ncbi:unnamed protein product [Staurois parvus]|uniref:Glycosyl transferase 64 domain-containing protein n=1 Tax=Staurois parvus TaxID=386267 RepID=A0ABN9G9D4_9NEOB|nr:unnamed protein product [Staurois parvus]